jgi:hypothetical protein
MENFESIKTKIPVTLTVETEFSLFKIRPLMLT